MVDRKAGVKEELRAVVSPLDREWRTPPLWGIGLQQSFQGGRAFFLHDGRAQSLREAIELHGGEGAASREGFLALPAEDQERLLRFLRSL